MTHYIPNYLPAFLSAMHSVNRELYYLLQTRTRLSHVVPVSSEWVTQLKNDIEWADIVQSFTSRFGRLQDIISKRLFRTIILLEGGEAERVIDILNIMEKRGILADTVEWHALRELRNELAYEYLDEHQKMAEMINATYHATIRLEQIILKCQEYAINKLYIDSQDVKA